MATGAGHRRNSGNDNNQRRLKQGESGARKRLPAPDQTKRAVLANPAEGGNGAALAEVLRMIVESTRVFREINSRTDSSGEAGTPSPAITTPVTPLLVQARTSWKREIVVCIAASFLVRGQARWFALLARRAGAR